MMKKLVSLTLAASMLMGIVGCSGDGGNDLAILALLAGSKDISEQTAPMKYLELMYNDEQGKKLNDIAMGGIDALSPKVQKTINRTNRIPMLENMSVTAQNTQTAAWWERLDINPETLAAHLNTPSGADALIDSIEAPRLSLNALTGSKRSQYGKNQYQPHTEDGETSQQSIIESKLLNSAASAASSNFSGILSSIHPTAMQTLFAVLAQGAVTTNDIRNQLTKGFEETNYHISQLESWMKEKDLRDARIALSSKVDEIASLNGIDSRYRTSLIKEFFTDGYEELYNRAYESAVERTALLNARADSTKVPGIMLISDILFMKEMSDQRLNYSSFFYTNMTLLRFRANTAKNDLARLKKIKAGLISDFPSTPTPEQLDILSVLVSWEIVLRAHIAVVYGFPISTASLEEAKNIGLATGTFGDYCGIPNNAEWGEVLVNAAAMPLTALFNDGDSLMSVFDMDKSGSLAGGKSLRIVVNGKNIAADYDLTPVYKKGLTAGSPSPLANECYIDPAVGRFILPRPVYWSTMDSAASIVRPAISDPANPVVYTNTSAAHPASPYGYSTKLLPPIPFSSAGLTLFPLGTDGMKLGKGTLSIRAALGEIGSIWSFGTAYFRIHLNDQTYIEGLSGDTINVIHLIVDGVVVSERHGFWPNNFAGSPAWQQLYITWDIDGGLSSGATINVYMNEAGSPILSATQSFTPGAIQVTAAVGVPFGIKYVEFDNLKIWNHVISEDPSYCYFGGENFLHTIYGAANNYAPTLSGSGNGVGFHKVK